MDRFIKRIDFYIDEFYLEKQLYKKGKEYHDRGWLYKDEFLTICLWKSRRPKKWYVLNSEEDVIKVTRNAFVESNEIEKIRILTDLKGVNIPTASAILSITDPKNYPIIDRRCVDSLRYLGAIEWRRITEKNWLKYLEIIRKIANKEGKDAREVEKGLFAFNRILLDKEYKNLYD